MDLIKFNKFIEPKFNEQFAWGSNDCNTLILEYLDFMLGTETLKIAYKKYHTKFGAMKFQKKYQKLYKNWSYLDLIDYFGDYFKK